MNGFQRTLQILVAVVAAMHLTACSKTVQWEEEVPLNTEFDNILGDDTVYASSGNATNDLDWRVAA